MCMASSINRWATPLLKYSNVLILAYVLLMWDFGVEDIDLTLVLFLLRQKLRKL